MSEEIEKRLPLEFVYVLHAYQCQTLVSPVLSGRIFVDDRQYFVSFQKEEMNYELCQHMVLPPKNI